MSTSPPVYRSGEPSPRLPVPTRTRDPMPWGLVLLSLIGVATVIYAVWALERTAGPVAAPVIVQVAAEMPTFEIRLNTVLYFPTETPIPEPTMPVAIDPTPNRECGTPEPGHRCRAPKAPTATRIPDPACPMPESTTPTLPAGLWCRWPDVTPTGGAT